MTRSAELRRRFLRCVLEESCIVSPILSGLVGTQLILGMLVGYLEGWPLQEIRPISRSLPGLRSDTVICVPLGSAHA